MPRLYQGMEMVVPPRCVPLGRNELWRLCLQQDARQSLDRPVPWQSQRNEEKQYICYPNFNISRPSIRGCSPFNNGSIAA